MTLHIFTHADKIKSINKVFRHPEKICAILIDDLSIKNGDVDKNLFYQATGKAAIISKENIDLYSRMCDLLTSRDSRSQASDSNTESLIALYSLNNHYLILALDDEDGFLAQFVFDEIIPKEKLQAQFSTLSLDQIQNDILPEPLKKDLLAVAV